MGNNLHLYYFTYPFCHLERSPIVGRSRKIRFDPMNHHNYYVYILSSKTCVLYIGVTNNLEFRVQQHKSGLIPGFTKKYKCDRLVYYEETSDINAAIAREKQLKGWIRAKKTKLIKTMNPEWKDLFEPDPSTPSNSAQDDIERSGKR